MEQVEKQNRDLEHQNQRLKNDIDTLKVVLFTLSCQNSTVNDVICLTFVLCIMFTNLRKIVFFFQTKLERSQHETNALENELQALKIEKEKQAIYVRELEQKNDDLERGQR